MKDAPTGVSEPSSVEGQMESTAQGRESLGLHLDMSSIHIPRTLQSNIKYFHDPLLVKSYYNM